MRITGYMVLPSLALAASLAAGCAPVVGAAPSGSFPGSTSGSVGDPTPTVDGGTVGSSGARYAGVFEADAKLDFTQPGVLPGLASPALAALSSLGTDPGGSLVNFAQAAGAINLDSSLRSAVGSVITQQLDSVLPQDVRDALTLISDITKITQTSTLNTSLTVHTPSANGSVQISVEVTGCSFDFIDLNANPQHVSVKTSAANLANNTATITATLNPHPDAPIADADLIFNGGELDLAVGDWILQSMGPLVFQPEWGTTDLNSTLQKLMATPCQDLGALVEEGVEDLTSLDVGPSLGTTICSTAVTLASAEITQAVGKLEVHGAKISNGRATLTDTSTAHPTADHQSDQMTGNWTWSFGGADVPSTIGNGARTGIAL
jgi:hypothetical protein